MTNLIATQSNLEQRLTKVQAELAQVKQQIDQSISALICTQDTASNFFQPGRTYRSNDGLHTFDCRAVTPHPDPRIGEDWAIGWHYADGTWHIAELGPDWWKRGWTDITDHPPEPER